MLEGILGRGGGLRLPALERTLTAETQEKHLLFLCFDLFYRFLWIFSFFFFPHLSVVVVDFIGIMKSNEAFELFFILSHMFYCYYKPLPLCWAFAILWSFPFVFCFSFLSLFLISVFDF